ncbi:MAG: membrane protein insertase YidC [Cyclobacteriaceae bacterium]|nr:membrane protein insertase YidC [Cyclobacteriaceae bacterium]
MDRNQAIGLVLISALMIIYFQFFAPKPIPVEETASEKTEIINSKEEDKTTQVAPLEVQQRFTNDSIVDKLTEQKFGIFSVAAKGDEEEVTIENENIEIVFNTLGANIDNIQLKDFKTYDQNPLIVSEKDRSKISLSIRHAGRDVNLKELYYTTETTKKSDTTIVTFTANVGDFQNVKQIYSIPPTGYKIGYDVEFNGISQFIDSDQVKFLWDNNLKMQERDIKISRQNAFLNRYTPDDGVDKLGGRSDFEEEAASPNTKWVAMRQKFFTSAIINEKGFSGGNTSTSIDEQDTSTVRSMHVALNIPTSQINGGEGNFSFYFGPNNYEIYQTVTEDFEDNLGLGWPPMKWVNKYVIIKLFHFFERFIDSYGIIIMLIVIVIKLALSPLSYKSYVSMAKTKVLKPEIDAMKEKYGDDQQKFQQEQMKLFSQVGVNPISGCIPMVLQMPILLAMFYFFPVSIELRQQSFLWATDLSTYDSVFSWTTQIPLISSFYGNHISLFTLLMTASTILYTWSNNQVSSVQGPMKTVSYMMPIMFLFVLNSFSSGLTFYYFVSNIVTFGQQALIRKFVDEDKIKAILEENKKKNANKKTSKFQQRLQDAMKASKDTQDQKKKK